MKRITFWIISILCFTACNNELSDIEVEPAEKQIELIMPEVQQVNVYSTATESECFIDNLWVLEFNPAGTTLLNDTLINGANILRNGQAIQLMPQLPFKPTTGNKICLIANSDFTGTVPSGLTYSGIDTQFTLNSKDYYRGGDHLPMYGEITSWSSASPSCELVRAVAKVQVQLGTAVSDVTTDFTADSITYQLSDFGDGGHIQKQTSVTGTPRATAHFKTSENNYVLLQNSTATPQTTNVYLYEYPSATQASNSATAISNKAFNVNRTHIILKKTNGANVQYYRLDFYNPKDSTYLNVLRNHHYIFTINRVYSKGYATEAEAVNNPGSNIEYEIKVLDTQFKSITSNGQYAVMTSSDTVKIPAGSLPYSNVTVLSAKYEVPTGSTFYSSSVNQILIASSNPSGDLTISSSTTMTTTAAPVNINATSTFIDGVITFNLGNISHRVIVKRVP
ncbi:MAG: hypothetical protein LBR84_10590 [Tannerella sp.]|jgi:hypothetical protein|nr:hypothetical protein [Tannerella sp.]